jgi:hypothetical protein
MKDTINNQVEKIKTLIFGIPATGENVINRQPMFKTYDPNHSVDFNQWSYSLRVGSRVKKGTAINPWYKDRKQL